MAEQYSEQYLLEMQEEDDQRWGICLALTLALHAFIAGLILFASPLLEARLPVEEAIIVSVAPPAPDMAPETGPQLSAAPYPAEQESEGQQPNIKPQKKISPEPKAAPELVPKIPLKKKIPEPEANETVQPEPVAKVTPQNAGPAGPPLELTVQSKKQVAKELPRQSAEDEKALADKIKQIEAKKQRADAERRAEAERQAKLAAQRAAAAREARKRRERAEREAELEAQRAEAAEAAYQDALGQVASTREDVRRREALLKGERSAATGRQEGVPAVEMQYWAAVAERLRSYWKLPEGRHWDNSLLAKVVLTIRSDGSVTRISFDEYSSDPKFNQLVESTIRQAEPMPAFPAILRKTSTEVGFKFKPGGLGNM